MRSASIISFLTLFFAITGPTEAAWISEIFLGRATDTGVPNAVEVTGLTGLERIELVIVRAEADAWGEVVQVIRVPVTQPLYLVSDGGWPGTAWSRPLREVGESVALQLGDLPDFSGEDRLALTEGARQVRLYAGSTDLQRGVDVNDPQLYPYLVRHAELLDSVTFTHAEQETPAFDLFKGESESESVVSVAGGWVLARPGMAGEQAMNGRWLVGSPDEMGHLGGYEPAFQVTPGRSNPKWDGYSVPEPSGLALAAAGMLLLMGRGCQGAGESASRATPLNE